MIRLQRVGDIPGKLKKMYQLCLSQCCFLFCDHMVKKQGKQQLLFVASAQLVTGTVFLSVY